MKGFAKRFIAVFLVIQVLILLVFPAFALEEKRTVKVAYMNYPGFIEEDAEGNIVGYGVEYLNEICKYVDWDIEYVYVPWENQLKMLEQGELDIVPGAQYNEERAKKYAFSRQPVCNFQCMLSVRNDADIYYNDFSAMNGKRIGIMRGDSMQIILREFADIRNFEFVTVEYSAQNDALEALMNGEIDILASQQTVDNPDIRIVGNFGTVSNYFACGKENRELLYELNYAMDVIFSKDNYYRSKLFEKYYGNAVANTQPTFTREEAEFISRTKEINIALMDDRQPGSYADEKGNAIGINPDILNIISQLCGIEFKYSFIPDNMDALDYVRQNPDTLAGGIMTDNLSFGERDLLISESFYTGHAVLLAAANNQNKHIDIENGKYRIGITRGYVVMGDYLRNNYPNLKIIDRYNNVTEGLNALNNGEIDLFTYDFGIFMNQWGNPQYKNISILTTSFLEESIGVIAADTPDNEMIIEIINKCIAVIPEKDIDQIERIRQSKNVYHPTFADSIYQARYVIVIIILAIALIIAFFLRDKIKSRRVATVIKNKNLQLAEAVEEAKKANNAKTDFLSSMSHDIRTPMNAIMGMTEIAMHYREGTPKQVVECLDKISISSTHLLALINDILDISKIESGKMFINSAEFSITDASRILVTLIRSQAQQKGINLRVNTSPFRIDCVVGDILRIRQVCINLITNAIKYTPEGGKVDVDLLQEMIPDEPDKVCLTCVVKDNGIGMSEEFQKVMYGSFSRATDSRVNKVAGSGLGLYICRQLVELMGGTLECESELGKGSTFTAKFIVEKGKSNEVYKLPPMRILAVDYDNMSAETLKGILEILGVSADVVNNYDDLVSLIEKGNSYNAAFVELGSPKNRGLEAVHMIRNKYGKALPVILTDISDMSEYSEKISEAGIDITMSKPYFCRTVYRVLQNISGTSEICEAEQSEAEATSYKGMNVLAAEDNDLNWEILHSILEMNGVTSERAENGRVCLDMLDAARPKQYDAVLMDIRMPVMDGREAARNIRKSNKDWIKNIPVIAMTADAFAEDVQACLDAGMNAHIPKPINTQQLMSVLNSYR